MTKDVLLGDPAVRAAAGDLADIDALLFGDAPSRGGQKGLRFACWCSGWRCSRSGRFPFGCRGNALLLVDTIASVRRNPRRLLLFLPVPWGRRPRLDPANHTADRHRLPF